MRHTVYHAYLQCVELLELLPQKYKAQELSELCRLLQFTESTLASSEPTTFDIDYHQLAQKIYRHRLLLDKHHQKLIKNMCQILILIHFQDQKISDEAYLNNLKRKILPLKQESQQYGTQVVRLLCQQASLYIAGHSGVCKTATKMWLSDELFTERYSFSSEHFVKNVELTKQELLRIYEREERSYFSSFSFLNITGFMRLTTGRALLDVLSQLAKDRYGCFLIVLSHFLARRFHAVGCKIHSDKVQWFDADSGIFQNDNNQDFATWLDFYLETNHYKQKFSFFNISRYIAPQPSGYLQKASLKTAPQIPK